MNANPTPNQSTTPVAVEHHAFLFLSTLPVPVAAGGAAFAAAAFLVAAPATPLRMVPITLLFAAAVGGSGLAAVVVRFLTTVPVLPSLDSLTALTLRVDRDVAPARDVAAAVVAVAVFLVLVVFVVGAADELVVETEDMVVVLREEAACVVERAFSTKLLITLDLVGDTGRAMKDLVGDMRSLGRIKRLLEDVGDRT